MNKPKEINPNDKTTKEYAKEMIELLYLWGISENEYSYVGKVMLDYLSDKAIEISSTTQCAVDVCSHLEEWGVKKAKIFDIAARIKDYEK